MSAFEDLIPQRGAFDDLIPAPQKQSALSRVGTGLADPIHGGAQLLTKMLPDSFVQAGNRLNNAIADRTGLVARLPEGGVDEAVRRREATYQADRKASGSDGIDWWRVVGNIASPVNRVIPMGSGVASGAASGAASAALAPVGEGDFLKEKATQMAAGGAGGSLAPALSRLISPKASTDPSVQMLRSEGVRPTVGQTMGGAFNAFEEKATSLPILGDMIASARTSAREDFNRAALNRALAPIGQKADDIGQDGVKWAGDTIGRVRDKAESMLKGFRVDPSAQAELSSLKSLAANLPQRERAAFDQVFRDHLSKRSFTAQGFADTMSELKKKIRNFEGRGGFESEMADALKEAAAILERSAYRANPAAAQLKSQADEAYANLVRVEGASKAAMNNGGVFTPGQLNSAVRQADTSVRDRATARGTALMQDLGNAGQKVLGNRIPDSGTAGRVALGLGTVGGAAALEPMALAGIGGLSALYARPIQNSLTYMMSARPQLAQPIAGALDQAAPGLGLLGTQVGIDLLR